MTDGVLEFTKVSIPTEDTSPPMDVPSTEATDFDPAYPGSTPEAPYGYFPDGRARKRRPHGSRRATTPAGRMPASESSARTAASLLGRFNELIAVGITMAAGLPQTGKAISDGNDQFVSMAYEALLTDPSLCKKILSAGATSGKAGLALAYTMLAANIVPAATAEIRERKRTLGEEDSE